MYTFPSHPHPQLWDGPGDAPLTKAWEVLQQWKRVWKAKPRMAGRDPTLELGFDFSATNRILNRQRPSGDLTSESVWGIILTDPRERRVTDKPRGPWRKGRLHPLRKDSAIWPYVYMTHFLPSLPPRKNWNQLLKWLFIGKSDAPDIGELFDTDISSELMLITGVQNTTLTDELEWRLMKVMINGVLASAHLHSGSNGSSYFPSSWTYS